MLNRHCEITLRLHWKLTLQSYSKLLNVCHEFAMSHELTFNTKKTYCIFIKPRWLKNISIPNLYLGYKCYILVISVTTTEHKYLGMYISDTRKYECDIKRKLKGVYTRGNILLKKFSQCNDIVKIKLFNSYCTSFYCMTLCVDLVLLVIGK